MVQSKHCFGLPEHQPRPGEGSPLKEGKGRCELGSGQPFEMAASPIHPLSLTSVHPFFHSTPTCDDVGLDSGLGLEGLQRERERERERASGERPLLVGRVMMRAADPTDDGDERGLPPRRVRPQPTHALDGRLALERNKTESCQRGTWPWRHGKLDSTALKHSLFSHIQNEIDLRSKNKFKLLPRSVISHIMENKQRRNDLLRRDDE